MAEPLLTHLQDSVCGRNTFGRNIITVILIGNVENIYIMINYLKKGPSGPFLINSRISFMENIPIDDIYIL